MPSQLSMESPTASKATAALQGFTVFRFSLLVPCNLAFNVIVFQVAEAGEGYLNIMANGGVGDVDIYVRFDEYPTWVSVNRSPLNKNMANKELKI